MKAEEEKDDNKAGLVLGNRKQIKYWEKNF